MLDVPVQIRGYGATSLTVEPAGPRHGQKPGRRLEGTSQPRGQRRTPMQESFVLAYRKINSRPARSGPKLLRQRRTAGFWGRDRHAIGSSNSASP